MIRFIFVALFLFLYLILGIPVYLILRLICKINKKAGDYASLRLVQWAFRVILKISGTEITVIGEENVPDEAVLFVASDRIRSKKRDVKVSSAPRLDEGTLLPVSGPRQCT